MKQTVEEAARKELFSSYACTSSKLSFSGFLYNADAMLNMFQKGAEWKAKQSPWISVKERLPETNKEVLVLCRRKRSGVCFVIENAYENGDWITKSAMYYETIAWMPIPSFDDILKANKDVLERIKEKGD